MTVRLHREWIAHSEASPTRVLLLTHGIFGAGSNWRGIARKLADRRRDWAIVLVDLRQHGRSDPGASPHAIASCAEDLRALVGELSESGPAIRALAGHSFGGKVVLAARARIDVEQTWMLDASPESRPAALDDPGNTVAGVLGLLERMPRSWSRRDDFIAAVVAEGHALGLAQWLAMNVVPDGHGAYVQRLDTGAMRELLADYYATDLWTTAEDPARGRLEVVIATRASVFTPEARARLGRAPDHVHVHEIEAGHWLHIEAPDAVVELFARELP